MIKSKIKKFPIICAITSMMLVAFVGCGDKKEKRAATGTTENLFTTIAPTTEAVATETTEIATQEIVVFEDTGAPTQITEYEYEEPIGEADISVDYDLTVLTANMIYVQVYNMMYSPDEYIGKTIKVRGTYYPMYYEATNNYYHYVMIKDAQACCQNGLEFIWDDGTHVYPDEYPQKDAEIEMVGTFNSYIEEDFEYYYLDVDDVIVLE